MNRSLERARRFYRPALEPGEEIRAVRPATAGGTGSAIGVSSVVGALVGWLYAITVGYGLLFPFVFGAIAGVLGGYVLAHRAATRRNGPGAVNLFVLLTNQRLLTVRRHAAVRRRILRSYPLDQAAAVTIRRYPIGQYRRLDLRMGDNRSLTLVVDGSLDLEEVPPSE